MSTNSRWWFVDLVVALALTLVGGYAAYSGLGGRTRVALVLPLVVFLPGYVLISAIFPGGGEGQTRRFGTGDSDAAYALGGPERVVLAVALSVAIVPMVAAVANFTPWGVTLRPILVGIVGFTAFFTLVALVRRVRVPAERRYSPGVPGLLFGSTGRRADRGATTSLLNVGIVLSFLLVASSVGFAVFNPPQGQQFTEFYVNMNNVNSDTNTLYQTDLGGEGVTVNVANHEGERVQYTVVAVLERVENGNVVEQSQYAEQRVTVGEGKTKQVTLTGDPSISGDNVRLRLMLYKGNPSGSPYLTTRLWLSSGSAPTQGGTTDGGNQGSNDGGGDEGEGDQGGDETTEPSRTTATTTTATTTAAGTTSTTATTATTTTTTTRTTTTDGFGTTTQSGTTATTTDDGIFDRDSSHLSDSR